MSSNKDLRKAKRAAYERKQEEHGKKVVYWIFGVLVALAIVYMIYSMAMAS
ncbi:hypothetical protein [Segatella buccae]|jgi:hypothetical protein|uniref:hypothetical protein n=1 Tax=Segatella buccae TaxID=28126 RepID=UPI0022E2E690|nr:hypothetical protein [Segatella buccae]